MADYEEGVEVADMRIDELTEELEKAKLALLEMTKDRDRLKGGLLALALFDYNKINK